MSLPWSTGVGLINNIYKDKRQRKIYDAWLAQLPYMGKNFISYDDYLSQHEYKKSSDSQRDILEKCNRIALKIKGGV